LTTDAAPTPVGLLAGNGFSPFGLVCEHACNAIPAEFDNLGLGNKALLSHIAWDPGADAVTRALNRLLGAPAVLGPASRLLYDCNRSPDALDAIPERSELITVPGNQNLSPLEVENRIDRFYRPFKLAVSSMLDQNASVRALVTIHSFTPNYLGKDRAVELGILHDRDSRFADAMLQCAPRLTSMQVARNQPYGPEHGVTHTLKVHGIERGLLNVMIELRSDHLKSEAQCETVAAMLAELLQAGFDICNDPHPELRMSN